MAISSSFEAIIKLSQAMSFLQLQALAEGVEHSDEAMADAKEALEALLAWGQEGAVQGVMEGIEAMSFALSDAEDIEAHSAALRALFVSVMGEEEEAVPAVDPEQVAQLEALFQAS